MKKTVLIIDIIFCTFLVLLMLVVILPESETKPKTEPGKVGVKTITPEKESSKQTTNTKTDIININVPFTSQAPGGDWNYPFNHTCEEASVLMVHYYLAGISVGAVEETKKDLLNMVAFEDKKYGFSNDTTVEETATFVRDYYKYKVTVVYNITADQIKEELEEGNPVVVPTAGQLLNNPNFTPPGPVYHMLVVKGYSNGMFITNDPGTRNGADYKYSEAVLMNAIHDFDKGNVLNGKSAMIIIKK